MRFVFYNSQIGRQVNNVGGGMQNDTKKDRVGRLLAALSAANQSHVQFRNLSYLCAALPVYFLLIIYTVL